MGNITNRYYPIEPRTVSNQSFIEGTSSYNNYTYQTKVQWVSGLLQNSSGASLSLRAGVICLSW